MKEELYEAHLQECAQAICASGEIRLVLIAGGSCSGKTTTTEKLARRIRSGGRQVETISLDDYYRNPENAVYLPDGTPDIEGIQSLRLDLLQQTMTQIVRGEPASIPFFDFRQHRRIDDHRIIRPMAGSVTIVEGLHALNPAILPAELPPRSFFRIYLYTDAGDGSDSRFLRRLVRDSHARATGADGTYARWGAVRRAEKQTIEPFVPLADRSINTFFDYERGVLADDAIGVLQQLPADHPQYAQAQQLIDLLKQVPLLPDSVVPADSLLREFIG